MPARLPTGVEITVSRRSLPADYRMPTMDMSTDHYSIILLISGDRRTITSQQSCDAHAGDVSMMAPFVYHRTVSLSAAPYESYLIKFTARAAEPLLAVTGPAMLEEMTEQKIHRFTPEGRDRLLRLAEEMRLVYESRADYAPLVLRGLLHRMLTLIREAHTGCGAAYFPSPLTPPVIDTLARMEERYAEGLRLRALAEELGYSESHLSRLFKEQLGCGFSEYLSRVRLRHVCALLTETELSVGEIAPACGFCSGDYLSTRFREAMGVTPGEFRKRARAHR